MGARLPIAFLLAALSCVASALADSECLICCGDAADHTRAAVYRGAAYPICSEACEQKWGEAEKKGTLASIVRKVEPRGAFFQADTEFLNPEFQQASPLAHGWLLFGVWVLAAVVSGGLSAGIAVKTHRSAPAAFVLGFMLPALGIAMTPCLSVREGEFPLRGPKIPLTREPAACPACGKANHPAAGRCESCGSELIPSVESEVRKTRK